MDILSYKLGKAQGGGSPTLQSKSVTITENGNTTVSPDTGYDGLSQVSVTTNVPVEAPERDVNFFDYDGKIVYSYTKAQFLALESLPENPTHEGLTGLGWGWTLSDAKEYVTTYDTLNLGQDYETTNNDLRIHVDLPEEWLSPYLGIGATANKMVTIDWGDGSTPSTFTPSNTEAVFTQHNYSQAGKYVISVSVESGGNNWLYTPSISSYDSGSGSEILSLYGDTSHNTQDVVYRNTITEVNLPNNLILKNKAFQHCLNLKKITLGKWKGDSVQGNYHFKETATDILISSFVERIANSDTFPDDVRMMLFSKVQYDSNVNYNQIFHNKRHLEYIGPIRYKNYMMTFGYCYVLKSIKWLNNNVIYSSMFNSCVNLLDIDFGTTNITEVQASAFAGCRSMKFFNFSNNTSVPTLANTNAFNNCFYDYKVVVPDSLYEDWIAETNWVDISSHIMKKSDYDAL